MDGEMDSYIERQMDNRISFEFANLGGLESPKGTVSGSVFFYHQTTSPGVLDIARNDFEFSQISQGVVTSYLPPSNEDSDVCFSKPRHDSRCLYHQVFRLS